MSGIVGGRGHHINPAFILVLFVLLVIVVSVVCCY